MGFGRLVRHGAVAAGAGLLAAACSGSTPKTTAGATAAATAASSSSPASAATGSTDSKCGTAKLRVGLDTDPVQIDPTQLPQTLGAYTLIDSVYDTLAEYVDGKPSPRLATSWTESADRLGWTIKIRKGVTFTDGTPVTAAAVKQNLNQQRVSTVNGVALSNLSFLDAPDDETLTIRTKTPWSAFPHVLTQFYTAVIAPAALTGADLARKPIGSGPYILTDWKPNDRLLLTCNDKYWGPKAKVASIEFRFIPDETARVAALKAGDIDASWLLLKDSIEAAQRDKSLATFRGPYAGQSNTLFNNTVAPLDDVRVRTALVKAIDRDALNKAFGTPGSEIAFGPFAKDHPWFVKTDYPTYDVAGAKKLIAEYSAANGGKPVSVTYSYTAGNNQLIDDVVAAIKQAWEAVGVQVKLDKQVDGTAFVTQVVLGNYQAAGFVGGMAPDPDLTLFNSFHQLGAFNFERFKNAELSNLLDKGRQAASEAERREAYAAAAVIIGREVPIAFGTFGGSWVAVSPKVTGMDQFKTFVFPTRYVGLSA